VLIAFSPAGKMEEFFRDAQRVPSKSRMAVLSEVWGGGGGGGDHGVAVSHLYEVDRTIDLQKTELP
jgi:hypothetical protein